MQVNILKLSKLDRLLAKRTCYQYFTDLKNKINATLSIIDKNESVIDPDVRDEVVGKLTSLVDAIDQLLEYKFPIMNYEEGLQSYFMFVKEANSAISYVRTDGIAGSKVKHKNKES